MQIIPFFFFFNGNSNFAHIISRSWEFPQPEQNFVAKFCHHESVWLSFAFVLSNRDVLKHLWGLASVWWLCIKSVFWKGKKTSQNCIILEASVLVLCMHVPLLVYVCILDIFILCSTQSDTAFWSCLYIPGLWVLRTLFCKLVFHRPFTSLYFAKGERECLIFVYSWHFVRKIVVDFHGDSVSLNWK